MNAQQIALLAILFLAPLALRSAEREEPVATKGDLLFSDDFERSELGDGWQELIPGFKIEDGHLVGFQARADHGAVGRVYRTMKDVVVSFRYRLAGSQTFNVVFDDKNHKGSHAGHIARVAIAPTQIRLGDDKEGIMRNDIFVMRRSEDPAEKAKGDELAKDRTTIVKAVNEQDRWYTMTIEIKGDRMRVTRDGEFIGLLQSPGLAHPTKESFHFTVTGSDTHFDDLKIWEAK